MAFCSLPCWTYFSALARTFCLLKPNNAIERELSRTWSYQQLTHPLRRLSAKPAARLGNCSRVQRAAGHPEYRQMVHRTRPIVRLEVMNRMVTKGYRKGVYRRVTSGTRVQTTYAAREIPRRAGENARLRDDAASQNSPIPNLSSSMNLLWV